MAYDTQESGPQSIQTTFWRWTACKCENSQDNLIFSPQPPAYNTYMCSCMSLLSKGSHVQDPGPTYFPPPSPGTRCCRICQSIFVLEFLLSGYSWFPVTYSLPKAIRAGQIDINRIIQKRFIWIWMMLVSTVFFFIATELKLLLCMYVIVPKGSKLVAFPVALSRHCFR